MKRLLLIAAIIAALTIPGHSWAAAGSCVESVASYVGGSVTVKFVCTGGTDAEAGTIPTQTVSTDAMALIKGTHYLYQVKAYPTAGGTAPDEADVTVNMDGLDLLGTKGATLIQAAATRDTFPYSGYMSQYRYPAITNTITVAVANQGTVAANFTIELVLVR